MTTFFSDTFTEAADLTLASHVPNVGTSWTKLWAGGDVSTVVWNCIASTGYLNSVGLSNNSGVIYTADVAYPSADYYLQWTAVAQSTIATRPLYYFVRIQDVDNMYGVRIVASAGGVQLYKKVSGTWSTLGSAVAGPANGSVLKLEIIGSTLTLYDDGVSIATATDSDITGAGKAGFGSGGGPELVTTSDDHPGSLTIDNLSIVNLGSGGGIKRRNRSMLVTYNRRIGRW